MEVNEKHWLNVELNDKAWVQLSKNPLGIEEICINEKLSTKDVTFTIKFNWPVGKVVIPVPLKKLSTLINVPNPSCPVAEPISLQLDCW